MPIPSVNSEKVATTLTLATVDVVSELPVSINVASVQDPNRRDVIISVNGSDYVVSAEAIKELGRKIDFLF